MGVPPGPDGKYAQELKIGENYLSAICGRSDTPAPGLWGLSANGDGVLAQGNIGVHGVGTTPSGQGVLGEGTTGVLGDARHANGEGVFGLGRNGVHGRSSSATDSGVWGENTANGYGVAGSSVSGEGVFGQGKNGVHGKSTSPKDSGIWGENTANGYGVAGSSVSGIGVYGSGTPAGHFEGDVAVTGTITVGGDVVLQNKDCAEDFEMTGDVDLGVVVVIDSSGSLKMCENAYDKRVAGVVSGAGEYKPGIILGREHSRGNKLPVALLGRVNCKVDARYSPVEVGDLLTTSPTPGHAMLASDSARSFGTVIGKALQPLAEGQGLIPILVALQ